MGNHVRGMGNHVRDTGIRARGIGIQARAIEFRAPWHVKSWFWMECHGSGMKTMAPACIAMVAGCKIVVSGVHPPPSASNGAGTMPDAVCSDFQQAWYKPSRNARLVQA